MKVELADGADVSAFPVGAEIVDHHGERWIVVGAHRPFVGLKRFTWWRRALWRLRRLFQ